jgi:hypothetical protein
VAQWYSRRLLLAHLKVRVLLPQPIFCRELEKSGCSRLPRTEEIEGSNPSFPTNFDGAVRLVHRRPRNGVAPVGPSGLYRARYPAGANGQLAQRGKNEASLHAYHLRLSETALRRRPVQVARRGHRNDVATEAKTRSGSSREVVSLAGEGTQASVSQ